MSSDIVDIMHGAASDSLFYKTLVAYLIILTIATLMLYWAHKEPKK